VYSDVRTEKQVAQKDTAMTLTDVLTQVARFTTETSARSYSEREANRHIVLGDNGEFWVTSARYAGWLVKAGYELLVK
jgi:hypothetical protein